MSSIVQLIADIWDEAQTLNRPLTIRKFKTEMEKMAKDHFVVTRSPSVRGVPHQSLLRLREDITQVFGLSEKEFCSPSREIKYVFPRHIFHYLARKHQISSFKHIAKLSGHKDHTTVIHSVNRVKNLLETRDAYFIKYWHEYLTKGDPEFTGICSVQVEALTYTPKKPTFYQNSTPFGIAWRTDV